MTENEFWESIDDSLGKVARESDLYKEKFLKRLVKLLIAHVDDVLDLPASERNDFLKRIFRSAGYNDYWRIVKRGFDTLLDFQNEFWNENTTVETGVSRNNTNLLALEEIRFEKFGELGEKGVVSVEREFKKAIRENINRSDFEKNLSVIGGKVSNYAQAIADTSLRGWDRNVTALKAKIAGIEKAIFDGPPPIPTSHIFCINHYQRTYTRDEIDILKNNNLEPVIIYCGGYRCRHRWRFLVKPILKKE